MLHPIRHFYSVKQSACIYCLPVLGKDRGGVYEVLECADVLGNRNPSRATLVHAIFKSGSRRQLPFEFCEVLP